MRFIQTRRGIRCRANQTVLVKTRSDRRCLVERSGFGVRCDQAAINFSFVNGIQEGLHRGFAKAQASLMWTRLMPICSM